MRTNVKIDRDNLNDFMEFDHVIRVHADGTVDDEVPGVWAPEVTISSEHDPESIRKPHVSQMSGHRWELLTGYSGQDSYSGPIMHDAEYIGGGMADDILSTPGIYVVVVVTDDDADRDNDEDDAAGWALARLIEIPGNYPVKVLTSDEDKATAGDLVTCGECERSWDDSTVTGITPAPAGRCPFEYFH